METSTTIGKVAETQETGEPDDAISVTSGFGGGLREKARMDLRRSLPG